MKKYFLGLLLVLLFPLVVFAKEDKLVKVYVYEAGGCPYCEAEIEYLEGLESYNKKFTIVRKELYVDHVNWEPGGDYKTGVKVANTFLAAGFEDASYHGTPFVVISDVYAATGYSTNLESYILDAYKKGDKDIVKCIEDGKDECIEGITADDVDAIVSTIGSDSSDASTYSSTSRSASGNGDIIWTVIICSIISVSIYFIKSNKDKNEILDQIKR